MGFFPEFAFFKASIARKNISSLILFETVKNGGFVAAALSFFR